MASNNNDTKRPFTVCLQSNRCWDNFPDNTSSNFANNFPRELDVKDYEVGLVDIYYHDYHTDPNPAFVIPDPPPVPKEGVEAADEADQAAADEEALAAEEAEAAKGFESTGPREIKDPLFDTSRGDDEIFVLFENMTEILVSKGEETTVDLFMTSMNDALEHGQVQCTIKSHYSVLSGLLGSVMDHVVLDFKGPEGYSIELPPKLMELIGFKRSTFPTGEFKSDVPLQLDLFNQWPKGPIGYIRCFKLTKTKLNVRQFEKTDDISTIVGGINLALIGGGFRQVNFDTDQRTSTLSVRVSGLHTKVLLSDFLNRYLDFAPREWISTSFTHLIPQHLFVSDASTFSTLPLTEPAYVTSNKLLVCANIIDAQYFGDKTHPILAVLDRVRDQTGEVHQHMDPILFYPINCEVISSIRISLMTDGEEFTQPSERPTTVVLLFRPKNGYQVQ